MQALLFVPGGLEIKEKKLATRNLLVFVSVCILTILLDQAMKQIVVSSLAEGKSIVLIPKFVQITHTRNTGAAFGLMSEMGKFVFLFSLFVVVLIVFLHIRNRGKRKTIYHVSLALIVGGAIGNLLDRLFRGSVVDFIDLRWWPAFNIADTVIVLGVIIFAISLLIESKSRKRLQETERRD